MEQPMLTQRETGSLQFANDEFEGTLPPTLGCAACRQPVTDASDVAGQPTLCASCSEASRQGVSGGSATLRFVRALLLGIPAAVVGSMLYCAATALGGSASGLLPMVTGLLVGGAVRLSRS